MTFVPFCWSGDRVEEAEVGDSVARATNGEASPRRGHQATQGR